MEITVPLHILYIFIYLYIDILYIFISINIFLIGKKPQRFKNTIFQKSRKYILKTDYVCKLKVQYSATFCKLKVDPDSAN